MYKFAAAGENELIVFGASRPGYSNKQVSDWIKFMKHQDIQQVCCLLPSSQISRYSDLLSTYKREFGSDRVCWSPIEDFQLSDLETLTKKILPFLLEADRKGEKVVVHCSGGVGRTGHILAAWLVSGRGLSNQAAIDAVRKIGKNPYEAAIAGTFRGKNPFKAIEELNTLLNNCRVAIKI